jgi:hypothetical protein
VNPEASERRLGGHRREIGGCGHRHGGDTAAAVKEGVAVTGSSRRGTIATVEESVLVAAVVEEGQCG